MRPSPAQPQRHVHTLDKTHLRVRHIYTLSPRRQPGHAAPFPLSTLSTRVDTYLSGIHMLHGRAQGGGIHAAATWETLTLGQSKRVTSASRPTLLAGRPRRLLPAAAGSSFAASSRAGASESLPSSLGSESASVCQRMASPHATHARASSLLRVAFGMLDAASLHAQLRRAPQMQAGAGGSAYGVDLKAQKQAHLHLPRPPPGCR